MVTRAQMRRVVLVVVMLLAGLCLLDPWPLLAAGRSKAAPKPAPEVCAKVREARKRFSYYLEQSKRQSQIELLVAQEELAYAQMGYRPFQIQAQMAGAYRQVEEGRRVVQDAKAAHDRLADDLIGKVPEPWPACEAPK
jgi:hypothetical protein